jgi:hypothetical protein
MGEAGVKGVKVDKGDVVLLGLQKLLLQPLLVGLCLTWC